MIATTLPNGAIVLGAVPCKEAMVILAIRPGQEYNPFVTWIAPRDRPTETDTGHYHECLADALIDFDNRIVLYS